jgi:hypothetical protein
MGKVAVRNLPFQPYDRRSFAVAPAPQEGRTHTSAAFFRPAKKLCFRKPFDDPSIGTVRAHLL